MCEGGIVKNRCKYLDRDSQFGGGLSNSCNGALAPVVVKPTRHGTILVKDSAATIYRKGTQKN